MAENILTSLGKIKTAIASGNNENPQAPANLTDALSGIAGAITEQKGSGSGGEGNGLSLYIFNTELPESGSTKFTNNIYKEIPVFQEEVEKRVTWEEIETCFSQGQPISVYIIYAVYGAVSFVKFNTYFQTTFSNDRYTLNVVQNETCSFILPTTSESPYIVQMRQIKVGISKAIDSEYEFNLYFDGHDYSFQSNPA